MRDTILNCIQFVASAIWNIITQQGSQDKVLTHTHKQSIYEEARAPANKLRGELSTLRKRLSQMPRSTTEYKKTSELIRNAEKKLRVEEPKAAEEIFRRVNSTNEMGSNKFDLHGLHVNEAIRIARDKIKPKLNETSEITVITGRGLHSTYGKSKLRDAMHKHFTHDLNLKCEIVDGNEGALVISKKSLFHECIIL
jgi:DNA-nicking Smr family endonuclease